MSDEDISLLEELVVRYEEWCEDFANFSGSPGLLELARRELKALQAAITFAKGGPRHGTRD